VNFSLFVNEMVFVEGGTFQMGCPGETYDCRNDALPYHSVTLDDFYISKYEVSVREFIEFLNAIEYNQHYIDPEYGNVMYYYTGAASIIERDGVYSHDNSNEDPSETPMSSVTWYGANAYCLWQGGRLPTEAEWEYAARGGKYSNGYHYAGSNVLDDVAMTEYISNRVNANPKGMKQPNELGLYDMSGNQSEYCSDYYNEDYYAVSPSINPTGPENSTSEIVTRGGCVGLNDFHFTVYERESQGLHYGYVSMGNGFRIVSNEKIF
jgi:formylglycine-generating enzyme required for sulfatase activity